MISNFSYSDFRDLDELVKNAKRTLKDVDYDTMIGTGLSGSLVVPVLAKELHKHFAIIRKENDASHAYSNFEGEIGDRWIFVDDFVQTGATLARVKRGVREAMENFGSSTIYVGTYSYNRDYFSTGE